MSNEISVRVANPFSGLFYTLFCIATTMIGYEIHHSIIYCIFNFFFAPFAWIYWLITHHVTWTIIQHTFSWFLN